MDELAKHFADLATIYGPNVINAALDAARVEAYSRLSGSLIWLGFALTFLFLTKKGYKKYVEYEPAPAFRELKVFNSIPIFICGAFSVGAFLVFVWAWIDPWTWTAINHPELYLAKRVFHI